jgi:LysM repeat protein
MRQFISILLLLAAFTGSAVVHAQSGNLLKDPSCENQAYKNAGEGDGGASFNVPADWNGWYTQSPRDADKSWENLIPNGAPHTGSRKRSGERSLNIGRGSATFTAAVYQQVGGLNPGTNVEGSIWVFMENVTERYGQIKIGIDPTGGTNPVSGGIIWSGPMRTVQNWVQVTVDATATAGTVTLFVYMTQQWPNDPNNVYLDDASLIVGGAGGSAPAPNGTPGGAPVVPVPTTPPLAPFVSAQGAQSDGSIVHTVQPGDTIDAIAVAYGVTRGDILKLNNLANAGLISPGQKLIIKAAPKSAASAAPESTEAIASSEQPTTQPTVAQNAAPTDMPASPIPVGGSGEGQVTPAVAASAPTAIPQPAANPTLAPTAPVVSVAQGSVQPAIDPSASTGQVCVLLFEDRNPNRIQEDGEALLAGGQIQLKNATANVGSYQTDGKSEPHCFDDLAPGDYTAVASAPTGFGLTTPDQLRLRVQAGATLDIAFGAEQGFVQPSALPADAANAANATLVPESVSSDSNSLGNISGLLVFGLAGIVLIGGLGAAFFLRRR